MFPKIGITEAGINALYDQSKFTANLAQIQQEVSISFHKYQKEEPKTALPKKINVEKIDTYMTTLSLYQQGKSLKEMAEMRELTPQTIESHLVKLYQHKKIPLQEILKFSTIEKLKDIKQRITSWGDEVKLSAIKEACPSDYTYFDIKLAQALIEEGDL